jgi:hypothetical protein
VLVVVLINIVSSWFLRGACCLLMSGGTDPVTESPLEGAVLGQALLKQLIQDTETA